MNIETLRLYCQVVRLHSFSRGAAESGVTQSAASQAIRQLEGDLGARLIDRSKRPFTLTAEGDKFFKACRRLLEGFDETLEDIARVQRRVEGTVRVAAIYSVGLHDMGALMQRFRSLYPDARVRLECLHPEEVVQSVVDDMVDVGILSYPPASRALSVIHLRNEAMLLVCAPGHRLARRKTVRFEDIAGEPFVAFDPDLAIRKRIDREIRRRNLRVEVVMELDNIESIKQAVSIGAGVSILPEPAIQKEVAMQTLRGIPIGQNGLTRPVGLIHRRQKHLSPTVTQFIEMLKKG
ncbi:MAG: LysR family transcriptional regulator [bacterium]